jgi:hypothetical protein
MPTAPKAYADATAVSSLGYPFNPRAGADYDDAGASRRTLRSGKIVAGTVQYPGGESRIGVGRDAADDCGIRRLVRFSTASR